MRWLIVLLLAGLGTAHAQVNLLTNPDFDLDPTLPGNGWTATGTGIFEWNGTRGDPAPPSAKTTQNGAESMILWQCVPVTAGAAYDFSARSFTHAAVGAAVNAVKLSVYESVDCTGSPIETVETDQVSYPNFALRERLGYVTPANAQSARIELHSSANGDICSLSWDHVNISEGSVAVNGETWGRAKARYR